MSSKEIKKEYEKKIEKILIYNENYYDKNSPIVTDKEYDILKKEILSLEKNTIF